MTYDDWLQNTTKKLLSKGIDSARLDALILLEDVTGHNRSYILAHPEHILNGLTLKKAENSVNRRLVGEPIAYILGKKEFYGNVFVTTSAVLIPRPESEAFIELLRVLSPSNGQKLLDIGTGSGALAISAKKEFPNLEVYASDISNKALDIAKLNALRLRVDINFIESNMFGKIDGKFDYVFANLPYVPTTLRVSNEVIAEPKIAVFSGPDGLDCIRNFINQVPAYLAQDGYVFIESLQTQHTGIEQLCNNENLQLLKTNGLVSLYKKF